MGVQGIDPPPEAGATDGGAAITEAQSTFTAVPILIPLDDATTYLGLEGREVYWIIRSNNLPYSVARGLPGAQTEDGEPEPARILISPQVLREVAELRIKSRHNGFKL
jgi:hypothetical protein